MKNDKILLNISNLDDVEKYKKLGITNFLFPLDKFSIGYTAFTLDDVAKSQVRAYILVNRILNDSDIDTFLNLKIPDNVVGFVVEDTGLMYELKDTRFELINFQNHLNNNYETVNYWLDHFDSVVLSTDITKEEIEEIILKSNKPLVLNVLFYPMIMYSRRNLVKNFYRHLNEEEKNDLTVSVPASTVKFKLVDGEYGTAAFDTELVDIREFAKSLNEEKVKFYLVNTEFLSYETVEKVIKGEPLEDTTEGFLNKKTVYKVGDLK